MTITTLPPAPLPTDSTSDFSTKAFTWVAALGTWTTQVNAEAATVASNTATAASAAATATVKEAAATQSAASALASQNAASASAASAAAVAGAFVGTSATSVSIGTGNKTFITQSGEQYTAGIFMTAVSAGNSANFMFGQVVSYSGTSLVINVQATGGSGAYSDWNLSLTGARGAPGTGITPQATGFTASGGTTAKTLTVDDDLRASTVAKKIVYYNSGTTNAINIANGGHQRWAPSVGAQTLTVTGWPASGTLGELLIEGVNLGAATITWPTINWVKADGSTTTTFSNSGVVLQASGIDWVVLWSRDGGTTIYGKVVR